MVACCREVHQLEDKFDSLELSQIPRRVNKATDVLVKTVSDRDPVPMGIFASNQYKPLICYKELEQMGDGPPALGLGANQPVAPSDPEVMELDEYPVIEPDPLANWRMSYLDYHLCEVVLTDKTEARWLTCYAKSFVLIEGEFYRRSHTRILQRCIPID
ncbi:uncharacterized protein [Miscanthus floridulus]|uniref:uncharacterized protein n=1 Tax=Miscanthus floridulus TaxID=154761 RepID=UPI003459CF58